MILQNKQPLSKQKMTQSGRDKKIQRPKQDPKVVITEEVDIAPPKEETEIERRIRELKETKPQIYQEYVNAIKSQKRATIGPDLSLRIG